MSGRRTGGSTSRDLCKRALWLAIALVLVPAWTFHARAADDAPRVNCAITTAGAKGAAGPVRLDEERAFRSRRPNLRRAADGGRIRNGVVGTAGLEND